MGIEEFAFGGVFKVEEILDPLHSLVANIIDEIFKLFCIGGGELTGMRVNGSDEGGGGLVEVGMQLFEMFVHLRYRVYHILLRNSN